MRTRNFVGLLALGCLLVLFCSGCGTTKGTDASMLSPEALPGDYPLGERTEFGVRITDQRLENVLFAYDSSQIMDSEMSKIQAAAKYLIENSRVRVVLEGHCDERGSNEYNMSLGEHRALAVRANLIRLGIDSVRMQSKSYGEERPVEPGHSEAAWRLNRRVEFALYR